MPAAWDDENATAPTWSDPEAWRGDQHPAAEDDEWGPDVPTLWAPAPELPTAFEEDPLGEEDENWCPGGWLEEWGNDEGEF